MVNVRRCAGNAVRSLSLCCVAVEVVQGEIGTDHAQERVLFFGGTCEVWYLWRYCLVRAFSCRDWPVLYLTHLSFYREVLLANCEARVPGESIRYWIRWKNKQSLISALSQWLLELS